MEYRNDFDIVGYGKVRIVVHPRSTLSLQRWAAPLRNDKIQNTVKFEVFVPLQLQNITRLNLTCKRRHMDLL